MIKVMVFIDGSWLFRARQILRKKISDPNLTIDYAKLPKVLAQKLGEQLGIAEQVDLVRTYFFASIPTNVDPQDLGEIEEQQDFYNLLREQYHYETEIFQINFKKRRLHAYNRTEEDDFRPKEKCVDIALASSMLYFAAIPYAYDAAIVVIGDEDFIPVLQHVRRLGKRVMIASTHGSCSDYYDPTKEPADPRRVRDVDTVFLDDIIGDILMQYQLTQIECQSDTHKGDRKVWTKRQVRKGEQFYCDECRIAYRRQRMEVETLLEQEYPKELLTKLLEKHRAGRISRLLKHKGVGFIRSQEGKDYYFHATNVRETEFLKLSELQYVQFIAKSEPSPENNNRGEIHELKPLE